MIIPYAPTVFQKITQKRWKKVIQHLFAVMAKWVKNRLKNCIRQD